MVSERTSDRSLPLPSTTWSLASLSLSVKARRAPVSSLTSFSSKASPPSFITRTRAPSSSATRASNPDKDSGPETQPASTESFDWGLMTSKLRGASTSTNPTTLHEEGSSEATFLSVCLTCRYCDDWFLTRNRGLLSTLSTAHLTVTASWGGFDTSSLALISTRITTSALSTNKAWPATRSRGTGADQKPPTPNWTLPTTFLLSTKLPSAGQCHAAACAMFGASCIQFSAFASSWRLTSICTSSSTFLSANLGATSTERPPPRPKAPPNACDLTSKSNLLPSRQSNRMGNSDAPTEYLLDQLLLQPTANELSLAAKSLLPVMRGSAQA